MTDDDREDRSTAVRTRGPELAVAGFLFAIALLVITDSLRVGIGWADDGPRAGYFPFYIGFYIASALLIGYFMFRHGKYKAVVALPVAIGVPLFFFAVFETWFLVPLPKGPLEQLLGL